ncbi:hypothetical protein [Streptomyces mirabilis]
MKTFDACDARHGISFRWPNFPPMNAGERPRTHAHTRPTQLESVLVTLELAMRHTRARHEKLRQERLDAYSTYAGMLINYRRRLVHLWFHEMLTDDAP